MRQYRFLAIRTEYLLACVLVEVSRRLPVLGFVCTLHGVIEVVSRSRLWGPARCLECLPPFRRLSFEPPIIITRPNISRMVGHGHVTNLQVLWILYGRRRKKKKMNEETWKLQRPWVNQWFRKEVIWEVRKLSDTPINNWCGAIAIVLYCNPIDSGSSITIHEVTVLLCHGNCGA